MSEGVRIAVIVRTLLHNTRSSTSLLKHLIAEDIQLASTTGRERPTDEKLGVRGPVLSLQMGELISGPAKSIWRAATGPTSIKAHVSIPYWWSKEIIFVLDGASLSRKDIVLNTANKHGGAHVDAELPHNYLTIVDSGAHGIPHYSPAKGISEPLSNNYLIYLRQIGHEILSSPQLLALAAPV